MELLTLITLACVSLLFVAQFLGLFKKQPHFPPGPRPLPVIGNVHQLPLDRPEQTFSEWGKQYGNLIYTRIFYKPTLVVNSVRIARDLLEKRSANYSDRPRFVFLQDLLGWKGDTTPMRYGENLKRHRRWLRDALSGRDTLHAIRPIQRREVAVLLSALLERKLGAPDALEQHVRRYTAAVIADIAYGRTISVSKANDGAVVEEDDEYLVLAQRATAGTVEAGNPASSPVSVLVDFFPILKYYPSWLPGGGFRTLAATTKRAVDRLRDMPFEDLKAQMAAGTARPSLVASLLEELDRSGTRTSEAEADVKALAGGLYGAGTDTSTSILTSFLLNVVRHPVVFRKAQAEMDAVVGPGRLPDFEDREALVYLECVMKEVYRWTAPVALCIPHASIEDDEYEGFFIPGGATFIPNIWGMSRNEDTYPDPEAFRPERFLEGAESNDPSGIVFGFGRRQCPGQHLADESFFLAAACIVATMDVGPVQGADGKQEVLEGEMRSGFVRHPAPFALSIRPRSPRAQALVVQAGLAG